MKRMISLVAVVLLLIMISAGDSYSNRYRYVHHYLGPITVDDHTWGGDPDGGDGSGAGSLPADNHLHLITTGFGGVDIILNAGFVEWLFSDQLRKDEPAGDYITMEGQTQERQRSTNANNKGN